MQFLRHIFVLCACLLVLAPFAHAAQVAGPGESGCVVLDVSEAEADQETAVPDAATCSCCAALALLPAPIELVHPVGQVTLAWRANDVDAGRTAERGIERPPRA